MTVALIIWCNVAIKIHIPYLTVHNCSFKHLCGNEPLPRIHFDRCESVKLLVCFLYKNNLRLMTFYDSYEYENPISVATSSQLRTPILKFVGMS